MVNPKEIIDEPSRAAGAAGRARTRRERLRTTTLAEMFSTGKRNNGAASSPSITIFTSTQNDEENH